MSEYRATSSRNARATSSESAVQACEARVVSPQDQNAAVLDIRHSARTADADTADPVGVARGKASTPAAQIEGNTCVRRTECVGKAPDEDGRVRDRRRGWGRQCDCDRLRSIPRRASAHRISGQVERFVPADPLPAGIGITLRAGTAQRMGQPLAMIDQFGGRTPFSTKCLAGRMSRIRIEAGKTVAFDDRNRAASGNAKCAITVDALSIRANGHALLLLVVDARSVWNSLS
jgi:hypothetical protein